MRHKVRWNSIALLQHRIALTFIFVSLFPTLLAVYTDGDEAQMPHQEVEHWANKIGAHIYHLSNTFAQYNVIRENFMQDDAKIQENDGLQLVKEMAEDVTNMMKFKIEAVKRIMNVAEEASLDIYKADEEVDYYNAKKINAYYGEDDKKKPGQLKDTYRELPLRENWHFDGIPVNENYSSVHVPTNVYEKAPDVLHAIRWSGRLDRTFKSNYDLDPTLSWQYFGSSTGFLRQYPATKWVLDEKDPDLYDSRLRSWYIEAANSAKDMIILLDMSGSMTGLNREIAKHVVLNILETLNENDFVNVFNFSVETVELVPCFHDTLVQANLENIGEFKKALSKGETKDIANFTQSLTKAFDLLQRYNKSGQGSQCNQAIMLITDGVPHNFEEIFSKYNWPHQQVRVFTYLIGRQEASVRDLKWMACANKGYFVHVTTLAEVREQVLKYIPVMARPMVMYREDHPHIWTGVYADIAGRRESPGLKEGYRLMTTVSVPVFDRRKTMVRSANLLGVAGTDVPIREIEKLVPPYKLGVNGYSFMVNRNGYILYHPDLRPVHEEANAEVLRKSRDRRKWFQDILKPNYNSVDFAEVELIDFDGDPRANHSELLATTMWRDYNNKLRRDMIEQRSVETTLDVKIHLDNMKRVVTRSQRYFTQKVDDTPFSLGIALPDGYGKYKVHGQIEITRAMQDPRSKSSAVDYFSSGHWSLHPEWVYCEYKYDNGHDFTPEELLTDFLSRAQKPNWKWRSTRTRPPEQSPSHPTSAKPWKSGVIESERRDNYYCDKDLIQSLLFDARATNVYSGSSNMEETFTGQNSGRHNFGITTSFVATRSGLTRWLDLTKPNHTDEHEGLPHFMKIHNRAIDEVWYKRAVDYYTIDSMAFVYSVPFDAATQNPGDVLVTATRAIFIEENNYRKAPAAVVGVTIKHSKFVEYFKNETFKCPAYPSRETSCRNAKTCEHPSLDCYLLDDNGFIIASEKDEDTGRFFGTLEGTIMESLVESKVYKRVRVFDYQAVCLDSDSGPSDASALKTPLDMLKWSLNWFVGNIFWILVKTHLYTLWNPNEAWAYTHAERDVQYPSIEEPTPGVVDYRDNFGGPRISRAVPEYLSDEANEAPDFSGNSPDYGSGSGDGISEADEDVLSEYMDMLDEIYDDLDGLNPDETQQFVDDYDAMGEFPKIELAYINKTRPRPCDKEVTLYMLQNEKLEQDGAFKPVKGKLSNCHTNGCHRTFSIQKVKQTNLILVAVNNLCPCESRRVDIEPVEVDYNETMNCNRLLLSHFRKRPVRCFNYHAEENEIKLCGGAGSLGVPSLALFTLLVLTHLYNTMKLHL